MVAHTSSGALADTEGQPALPGGVGRSTVQQPRVQRRICGCPPATPLGDGATWAAKKKSSVAAAEAPTIVSPVSRSSVVTSDQPFATAGAGAQPTTDGSPRSTTASAVPPS